MIQATPFQPYSPISLSTVLDLHSHVHTSLSRASAFNLRGHVHTVCTRTHTVRARRYKVLLMRACKGCGMDVSYDPSSIVVNVVRTYTPRMREE